MLSASGALPGVGAPRLESCAEGLREAGGGPQAHGPGSHRAPGHRSPGHSGSPARSGTARQAAPSPSSGPAWPCKRPRRPGRWPSPPAHPWVRLISPEPGRLSWMCAGSGGPPHIPAGAGPGGTQSPTHAGAATETPSSGSPARARWSVVSHPPPRWPRQAGAAPPHPPRVRNGDLIQSPTA